MVKRHAQALLWPRTYFSSQLKRWRSSFSAGERRRTVRPTTVTVPDGGAGSARGGVEVEPCKAVAGVGVLGRRPQDEDAVACPARGGGAVSCATLISTCQTHGDFQQLSTLELYVDAEGFA